MKHTVHSLAFIAVITFAGVAQAQHYDLDDDGSTVLPTGSKISCITMTGGGQNTATCTMKLAGGDTKAVFPETISRKGIRYEVLSSDATPNRAWADCGEDCVSSK